MKFTFTEKKLQVSDELKAYAERKIGKMDKFFRNETEATVTFSEERGRYRAEVTLFNNGMFYRVSELTSDMAASIDSACAAIERQIRKHKTRLEKRLREGALEREVKPDIFAAEPEEEDDSFPIIRTKRFSIKPMTPEEARKVIRSYIETARRDSRWDYSPPRLNIPSAKRPIRIDGIAEEFEWENALTLRGQYAIGERKPDTRDNPVWRLLWDRRYLYLSAVFRNTQYRQVGKMPYEADCLEVFLRIDRRIGLYWELVVNFENRVLCDYRSLNYWGGFHDHRMPPDLFPGLQYRSRIRDGILTIEIAVPWKLFPGFANTRSADSPKKGEEVLFSLVRILSRSDSDRLDYCSAVPLLYGGHNLYGQITGILN